MKLKVKFALASTSALPPSGTEALIGLSVIPNETIQCLTGANVNTDQPQDQQAKKKDQVVAPPRDTHTVTIIQT